MAAKRVVNDAQRKALDEADAIFGKAYEEAAVKLAAAGLRLPEDGDPQDTSCIACDCSGYMFGGTPPGTCKRQSCRHSRSFHGGSTPP
jgi:hypothetical protein